MTGQPGFDQNSPTVQFTLSRRPGPGGAQTLTAVHRSSGKPLAVHEIHFPPAATPDERRAQAGQVRWEVERLALLHEDPAVLTVYGVVEEQNRLWIVTEALSGTNLARIVAAGGPLPMLEAARVASAVLGALAAAHSAGVAHRGVRPAAVVRCDDGRIVLTGFCATPVKSFPDPAALEFADPHRVRTGQATFGGDVFSAGATLYHLLDGTSPFARPTPQATAATVQNETPPAPRHGAPLTTIVMALLTRNQAAVLTPAVAREQVDALLAANARPAMGSTPVPGPPNGPAPARPVPNSAASPTPYGQAQNPAVHPAPVRPVQNPAPQPLAVPAQGVAPPFPAPPPWTPSRTLWLLTALAATVTALIAVAASWGSVRYAGETAAQAYSGTLFAMLKTDAGGSTEPKPGILGLVLPLMLPVLGTALFGVIAALVSRRLGKLCAGFALLGLTAEVGCYLWVAGIPTPADFGQPSVVLHAGGYLGLTSAAVALALGLAGLFADRAETARIPTPVPVTPPIRPVGLGIRITAGVGAVAAVIAAFLLFGTDGSTRISSLEWSQMSILPEGCCLLAILVQVLFLRTPSRPLTATMLIIPAAIAFVLQVMPLFQVIGLNARLIGVARVSISYGWWIGFVATLAGLVASALGYLRPRTTGAVGAAGPAYGTAPYGVPSAAAPPPAQGGHGTYAPPIAQRGYPQAAYPQQQQPGQAPGAGQSQG
ncbi:MAG TPA: hypothetical protein VGX23_14085 [Actinocrinis sp.]|nr:hypothetical protein [Actinocrinis sp.]